MARAVRVRRAAGAGDTVATADFCVDPLLVGADREFVESFPEGLPAACGVLPLRRFHQVGLVVPRRGPKGRQGLAKLQHSSRVRLVAVPPVHDYGLDLFLRYLEKGANGGPPLWLPESRRVYLMRQGEFTSPKTVPLVASIVLTSPLAASVPVVVCMIANEGHVLYLQGTGLKVGARFPGRWFKGVLARLKIEFGMDGQKSRSEPWVEGRGGDQRGLQDLTGLLLPPAKEPCFILEPRNLPR